VFEEQEEEAKDWRVDARLQAACKADAGEARGRRRRLGGTGALKDRVGAGCPSRTAVGCMHH